MSTACHGLEDPRARLGTLQEEVPSARAPGAPEPSTAFLPSVEDKLMAAAFHAGHSLASPTVGGTGASPPASTVPPLVGDSTEEDSAVQLQAAQWELDSPPVGGHAPSGQSQAACVLPLEGDHGCLVPESPALSQTAVADDHDRAERLADSTSSSSPAPSPQMSPTGSCALPHGVGVTSSDGSSSEVRCSRSHDSHHSFLRSSVVVNVIILLLAMSCTRQFSRCVSS